MKILQFILGVVVIWHVASDPVYARITCVGVKGSAILPAYQDDSKQFLWWMLQAEYPTRNKGYLVLTIYNAPLGPRQNPNVFYDRVAIRAGKLRTQRYEDETLPMQLRMRRVTTRELCSELRAMCDPDGMSFSKRMLSCYPQGRRY